MTAQGASLIREDWEQRDRIFGESWKKRSGNAVISKKDGRMDGAEKSIIEKVEIWLHIIGEI